jgi:hypothetical protein
MSEEFALKYLSERIEKLKFKKYHVRYRDFMLLPYSSLELAAYNELWLILDDPMGFTVESDYGMYDTTGSYASDNIHEHRGQILITNPDPDSKRIKFIQAVIVN